MLERTVDFGDENSWEDFGIIFESMTLGAPEPQLVLIDVPFRNGPLDETDYFGDIKYRSRLLTMNFLIPWEAEEQHAIYSEVQNGLNGKRKKIVFSADEDWYYEGRLVVGDFKVDNGFFKFPITATVDPYKYSDSSKTITSTSTATDYVFKNDCMKTIPTITTSASITVTFDGTPYSFTAGTHRQSAIIFVEGNNTLRIQGAATVTVSYKEGRL